MPFIALSIRPFYCLMQGPIVFRFKHMGKTYLKDQLCVFAADFDFVNKCTEHSPLVGKVQVSWL